MRLVHQPEGTNLSGQCVIAMLLGVTLDRAVAIVGTSRFLRTKDVVHVLRSNECYVGDGRLVSSRGKLPADCIVSARWPGGGRHWTLRWRGRIYDPAAEWAEGGSAASSYIDLTR
jgi:hypothetical protein